MEKIVSFFNNRWTRFAFSFLSIGYLLFVVLIAWLTFGYSLNFSNAPAVFFLYTFINIMFAIVIIYTRRQIITRIATLIIPPILLVVLVYGFGNWYLFLPPFIAIAVSFFASGAGETLKVVFGTVYLIVFVVAFLAYITIGTLKIPIPYKMDLGEREHAMVQMDYTLGEGEVPPFRLVCYVSPVTQSNRTASYFIEKTESDIHFWNLTCEKTFGSVKAATVAYDREFEIKWIAKNKLLLDGRLIEIDEAGKIVTLDNNKNANKSDKETGIIEQQ